MLINVSPNARTFHLRSRFFSYILTVMENGQIENLYFGKAIQDRPSFAHLHEEAIRGMTAFNAVEGVGVVTARSWRVVLSDDERSFLEEVVGSERGAPTTDRKSVV